MPKVLPRHTTPHSSPYEYRPPWWIIIPVLFLVIWFGVQIIGNVTHSLRAITGLVTNTQPPPQR